MLGALTLWLTLLLKRHAPSSKRTEQFHSRPASTGEQSCEEETFVQFVYEATDSLVLSH